MEKGVPHDRKISQSRFSESNHIHRVKSTYPIEKKLSNQESHSMEKGVPCYRKIGQSCFFEWRLLFVRDCWII